MPCLKSAQIFTKMMKTHFFTELDFMNNQITISNLRLVPGILFNLLNADKKIDTAHSKNSIEKIDLALKIGDFSVFCFHLPVQSYNLGICIQKRSHVTDNH